MVGAWCDLPGAVPQDEIVGIFKDKGKWPKNNNMLAVLPRQSLNYSDDNQSLPLEPASVGKAQTVAAHVWT